MFNPPPLEEVFLKLRCENTHSIRCENFWDSPPCCLLSQNVSHIGRVISLVGLARACIMYATVVYHPPGLPVGLGHDEHPVLPDHGLV